MSSNGTQVIGVLLRDMAKVEASAVSIRTKLGLVGGAIAALGGAAVLKGLWSIIEASKDLNKELERTKQLGGEFASTIDAQRAAAFRTTNAVPTSTASENVRLIREMGTTLGHPEPAIEMVPEASKAAFVISHFTGESQEQIIKNLTRVADLRGQIYTMGADGKEHVDPKKLTAEINAAANALILGGGFIKSNDLLMLTRQGGAAAKNQTPEAFYAAGVEAAIAMGAAKTGTAETGLFQQFIGGTMTKKVAEHLTEAGLLRPQDWTSGRSGGVVVAPQAAKRFEPMMKDPVAWLTTGEGGAAIKAYATKNAIEPLMAIFQLFGRQTVQRLVSEVTSNAPQFARAREIYGGIPSVDKQYAELQAHDLDTNITAVAAAWKTFMQALGDAGVPTAIGILHSLTDGIQFLTAAVNAHPTIAADLLAFAGGLAAITALSGSILVVTTALGPFAAGIRLVVGALSAAEVATAATGATALAGGIGAVTAAIISAVSAIAGPLAIVMGWYQITKDLPPLQPPKPGGFREQHGGDVPGMVPQDGFDASGRPIARPQSYHLPAGGGPRMIQVHTDVNIDGRKVGRIVSEHQADMASRPTRGPNGFDPTLTPSHPSDTNI